MKNASELKSTGNLAWLRIGYLLTKKRETVWVSFYQSIEVMELSTTLATN